MVREIQDIASAPEKMRTGIEGLDLVFGGGIFYENSVLIQGTPGAGKTPLGMQIVASGILMYDEPGIILSFEQFPQLLYRDALSFGWDLRAMEEKGLLRVFFLRRDDLYSSFPEIESAAISHVTDATIDLGAKRVFLDGAENFWRLPLGFEERQKIFLEFVMKLKGLGLTPLLSSDFALAGKAGHEEIAPEEFAVDTIIRLEHCGSQRLGDQRRRTLEVIKARGQECLDGKHPFRIRADGVHVSPFVQLPASMSETTAEEPRRLSTGIEDLDALLHGGVAEQSTTMIAGMTATGKTTFAAHFMAAGLAQGEPGIFVSLSEEPAQLLHNMQQRQLRFVEAVERKQLTLLHVSTPGMQLIEFYHQLRELVELTRARRVVIDGVRDLLALASGDSECEYYLSLFRGLFRQHKVTSLFTYRVEKVSGLASLAAIPQASLVDNLLYLGVLELESKLRRVLAIFKTRGELTDDALRELIFTPTHVRISNLFSGISGILMGSATGHLTQAGRELVEPLLHIRDFINNAQIQTPEQARYVADNLRQEFNVLAERLSKHFDLPHT